MVLDEVKVPEVPGEKIVIELDPELPTYTNFPFESKVIKFELLPAVPAAETRGVRSPLLAMLNPETELAAKLAA